MRTFSVAGLPQFAFALMVGIPLLAPSASAQTAGGARPKYPVRDPADGADRGPRVYQEQIEGWTPEKPTPYGFHVEERRSLGLIVAGALVFGVPYGAGVYDAAAKGDKALYAPVVGPIILLCQNQGDKNDFTRGLGYVFSFVDFGAQVAGLAMLGVGVLDKHPRLVRDAGIRIVPTPMRIGSASGAGIAGSF